MFHAPISRNLVCFSGAFQQACFGSGQPAGAQCVSACHAMPPV